MQKQKKPIQSVTDKLIISIHVLNISNSQMNIDNKNIKYCKLSPLHWMTYFKII